MTFFATLFWRTSVAILKVMESIVALAKQQGKNSGRPAGRDAGKVAKVAKALEKDLSVAEIITLTGLSRASVKRYRLELATAP